MDNKLIQVVIAITVGIVVLGSLLVPVITEASTTEKTFNNVGYYDMVYSETDDLTFDWDHTAPNQVTINDEVVVLPVADEIGKTILCGDNWLVRYFLHSSSGVTVQYYGSSGSQISANVNEEIDITVECSNGSVSVTNTADTPATASATYTHIYVVSGDGNLVMKNKDQPAYLNGDSEIIAMGLSRVGTVPNMGVSVEGTINDGFTWSMFRGSEVTFTDEAADYTSVDGYIDLYSLNQLTATATNSTGSSDLTYSYFIVPAEVTAELSQHLDTTEIGLLAVIPVLMIVAFLIFAVRIFGGRD